MKNGNPIFRDKKLPKTWYRMGNCHGFIFDEPFKWF